VALSARPASAGESEFLASLRAGGVAVLLRHSQTTSGVGDPPGFKLDDCSTQRNLDADGRAQAQRFGKWFMDHGIVPSRVRNSPWCRARDTAHLAFGRTEDWPALGNVFGRDRVPEHVADVQGYVAGLERGQVAVLVSHGVTIAAIVGEHPAPGEGIVVRATSRDGKHRLVVLGRIVVP
jgi:phosphohistidine phosphatase SixA